MSTLTKFLLKIVNTGSDAKPQNKNIDDHRLICLKLALIPLQPTCASHSLATTVSPHSGSARFAVMSRLQEMQHYICLQPTGTRTRSCYMIKECVWLYTPPPISLVKVDSIQAYQNGEDTQIAFNTVFFL